MLSRTTTILSDTLRKKVIVGRPRNFWQYLIGAFNMYDQERVKAVGPDRACAEWLLKNGAFVRWLGHEEILKDYNQIGISGGHYIEAIDCTGSSVSNAGFQHLDGLKHVKEVKLIKCWSVGDGAMRYISECIPDTLRYLDVISCNVTEEGLLAVRNAKTLKRYRIGNLPTVENVDQVVNELKKALPECEFEHVTQVDESHKQKKSFLSGLFG